MDHNELLSKCNFHMAYVGRGLFIELTKRKHPIITVDYTGDIKAIDMCCLMYDELETVNRIIHKGLSFGKEPDKSPSHVGVPFIRDLPSPLIKSGPSETVTQDTETGTSGQTPDSEKPNSVRQEQYLETKSTGDRPGSKVT